MISPSDVVLNLIVYKMVMVCRSEYTELSLSWNESMCILRFLASCCELNSWKYFDNLNDLLDEFSHVCRKSKHNELATIMRIQLIEHSGFDNNNIDGFMNFMDSIPLLQKYPKDVDPNGVNGPIMIGRDGLLGLVLRSISLKWRDLEMEEIGRLYEKVQLFLQESPSSDSSS